LVELLLVLSLFLGSQVGLPLLLKLELAIFVRFLLLNKVAKLLVFIDNRVAEMQIIDDVVATDHWPNIFLLLVQQVFMHFASGVVTD